MDYWIIKLFMNFSFLDDFVGHGYFLLINFSL